MVLDWHILLIHSLLFYLLDMVILLVNTEAMLTTGESMLNTEIYLYRQSHKRLLIRRAFNDSITMATELILTCTYTVYRCDYYT